MPTSRESAIGRSGDGRSTIIQSTITESTITRSTITRSHSSAVGRWEMTFARPAPALRPYVREYNGWFEHMASPLCRREPPTEIIPVIINFGAPVRIFDRDDLTRWTDYGSFTTGTHDRYALVGSAGPSGGIQCNLTILGARLFFDRPLHGLTNAIVRLDDLFGADGRRLVMELYDAPDWEARFDILDRELSTRIFAARPPSREVVWTWRRLTERCGQVPIATLVDEIGWSQKHLIEQFRAEIGLPPKALARVLRFGQAVRLIKSGRVRLADVAHDCGYYDQAHFTRDTRTLAGVTPSELVKSLMPDSGGFIAENIDDSDR
jgi:AraC-like DNA-binding protein